MKVGECHLYVLFAVVFLGVIDGKSDEISVESLTRLAQESDSYKVYDSLFSDIDSARSELSTIQSDIIEYCMSDLGADASMTLFISESWRCLDHMWMTGTLWVAVRSVAGENLVLDTSKSDDIWFLIYRFNQTKLLIDTIMERLPKYIANMEGQACIDTAREWLAKLRELDARVVAK